MELLREQKFTDSLGQEHEMQMYGTKHIVRTLVLTRVDEVPEMFMLDGVKHILADNHCIGNVFTFYKSKIEQEIRLQAAKNSADQKETR